MRGTENIQVSTEASAQADAILAHISAHGDSAGCVVSTRQLANMTGSNRRRINGSSANSNCVVLSAANMSPIQLAALLELSSPEFPNNQNVDSRRQQSIRYCMSVSVSAL